MIVLVFPFGRCMVLSIQQLVSAYGRYVKLKDYLGQIYGKVCYVDRAWKFIKKIILYRFLILFIANITGTIKFIII